MFLLLSLKSYLYIWNNSPSLCDFCKYLFPQSRAYFWIFLISSLAEQKLLVMMKSSLSIISFTGCVFGKLMASSNVIPTWTQLISHTSVSSIRHLTSLCTWGPIEHFDSELMGCSKQWSHPKILEKSENHAMKGVLVYSMSTETRRVSHLVSPQLGTGHWGDHFFTARACAQVVTGDHKALWIWVWELQIHLSQQENFCKNKTHKWWGLTLYVYGFLSFCFI